MITAYRASAQASGQKPEGLVGLTCLQSLLPPSGQEGEVSPTLNKTTHNFSDLTTRTLTPVIQTEAADRNAGRMHVSPWRVLPVPETDPYNPCWLPDSYSCPRPEAEAVSWLSSGDSLRAHSWTKRTDSRDAESHSQSQETAGCGSSAGEAWSLAGPQRTHSVWLLGPSRLPVGWGISTEASASFAFWGQRTSECSTFSSKPQFYIQVEVISFPS